MICPTSAGAAPEGTVPPVSGERYFPQTGYWIADDTIWDYFLKRGGVRTFGYPASRKFLFRGTEVQFFQRRVIQIRPDGSAGQLNILDEGLLEYNVANGATFPGYDEQLVASAPRIGSPNYQVALLAWIEQHVPNTWKGTRVNFLETFLSTVGFRDAYPDGSGDPDWMPGINLEMWGAVTSRPAPDPNNSDFIYLRFQRGIMHYDRSTGRTQGLLLGDHLKSIITGRDLPQDLEEIAKYSPLYRQHDDTMPNGVARPAQLPGTDLKGAFEREGSLTSLRSSNVVTGDILDWPQNDQEAIHGLQYLLQQDIHWTQLLAMFPWLADGLTPGERLTIAILRQVAQEDADLARHILTRSWLADDLTEDEQETIRDLLYVTRADASLARHLLNSSWMSDGLTEDVRKAIAHLRVIVLESSEFARTLLGSSLLDEPVGPTQFDAIATLASMREAQLQQIAERAWYKDGLTDKDVALIVVLSSVIESDELFSRLIRDGRVLSTTIYSPMEGSVNLYAVRRSSTPLNYEIFEEMRLGIETIEEFMALRWRKPNVIVLIEPDWRFPGVKRAAGVNYSSHIVIRHQQGVGEFRRVLFHELAHFYWSQDTGPNWFLEGAAQLLAYLTLYVTEQVDLNARLDDAIANSKEYCQSRGVSNIQEFLEATNGQTTSKIRQSSLAYCPHILGESFLLGMYVGLGRDFVSSSLRDLYSMAVLKGEAVTEEEIYNAFLANTPPDKEAKFREIYQRFHGGPIPGS